MVTRDEYETKITNYFATHLRAANGMQIDFLKTRKNICVRKNKSTTPGASSRQGKMFSQVDIRGVNREGAF